MPQMGVSVAEGTIVEWRKRPGDWVERRRDDLRGHHRQDRRRDPVAGGRPARERILVEPGDTVDVGTLLAELDAERPPGRGAPRGAPRRATAGRPARRLSGRGQRDGETDRSGFYSPVVRRIADEHGIDLSQVEGTGIGGRVRKRDLVALIESATRPSPERNRRAPSGPCTSSPRTGRRRRSARRQANGGGVPADGR